MTLPQERVLRDDSNDTPKPTRVEHCQNLYCGLELARIRISVDRWNRLNEPVFMAASLFRLTELGYFEKLYAAWKGKEVSVVSVTNSN